MVLGRLFRQSQERGRDSRGEHTELEFPREFDFPCRKVHESKANLAPKVAWPSELKTMHPWKVPLALTMTSVHCRWVCRSCSAPVGPNRG